MIPPEIFESGGNIPIIAEADICVLGGSHQNQIFAGLTTETIDRLVAGRMIDADSVAHAGIRVMVNMNQTGEATGVAAYAALDANIPIRKVSPTRVRTELAKCGAIIL
jgi:hypothetical protein